MPTVTDYIFVRSGSYMAPQSGVFVRAVNNVTSTAYVSAAATDANGAYSLTSIPAGTYTLYTGPTSTGAWTAIGDGNYAVGTVVGDANSWTAAQTFTASAIMQADLRHSTQAPVFAASYTPNAAAGEIVNFGALSANLTVNAPTNGAAGQVLRFIWTQNGTGGWTITYNAVYKTTGAAAIVTTASTRTIDTFLSVDGSTWFLTGRQTGQA